MGAQEKDYAHQRAIEVLNDAIAQKTICRHIETGLGAYHRIRYDLPTPPPSVSVIIPTKDRIDLLSVCLKGLLEKTTYANFEILVVDNNSTEVRTFEYFETIQKNEKVSVLKFPGEFNFSAINNFAVSKASGEIIILLNNDIEIIENNWLKELVSSNHQVWCCRVGFIIQMIARRNNNWNWASLIRSSSFEKGRLR